MARITVEDCLQKINNRFTLIHMASQRVRQLRKGDEPTIESKNKDIVVSLREVAAGHIRKADPEALKELSEALLDLPQEFSEPEENMLPETETKEGDETKGN